MVIARQLRVRDIDEDEYTAIHLPETERARSIREVGLVLGLGLSLG